MDIQIPLGVKKESKQVVTFNQTALKYGSGLAEVYATPAMIAFMEQTAYTSIEPFLPDGYSSVGISINVEHKKATLPGKEVCCHSEVVKVEGKRVSFTIAASDASGEIGYATHTRYIINSQEFIKRLK